MNGVATDAINNLETFDGLNTFDNFRSYESFETFDSDSGFADGDVSDADVVITGEFNGSGLVGTIKVYA